MDTFYRIRGWLKQVRALLAKEAVERELEEELAFHLAMEAAQNERRGMSPAEARRTALVAFRGVERTRQEVRAARWVSVLETLVQDARYALRSLARTPVFTGVAVLTLALGIGANAALFGLLDALLLRSPTGVPASDRLVRVDNAGRMDEVAYADFADLREAVRGRIDLATYLGTGLGIASGAGREPVWATGQLVSANYFHVLGVRLARGRAFLPEEDRPGGAAVAVISDELWRSQFDGDPAALGRTVSVNGSPFTVVGVAPPGFVGTDVERPASVWLPVAAQPVAMPRRYDVLHDRRGADFSMIGRLAPELGPERANAVLRSAALGVEATHPVRRLHALRPAAAPLRGWLRWSLVGSLSNLIAAAWVVTGLILLIACANVANLMLSRSVARRRETGIRVALGAGRPRLLRMLLTESLALSLCAGIVGTPLAFCMAGWFQARFRGPLAPLDVSPDATTLGFSLGVALLSALIFGVLPALGASRADARAAMSGSDAAGLRRTRAQAALVVAQVALSLVLLMAGALFLRRLQRMQRVDVGFDAAHVLAVSFPSDTRRATEPAVLSLYGRLAERLAAIPGVVVASVPSPAPFERGLALMEISRPGAEEQPRAEAAGVGPGYLRTMGIRLERGRDIEARDLDASERVAVISRSLAERLWPGQDPLGRTIRLDGPDREARIVGVSVDVRLSSVNDDMPQVFVPYTKLFVLEESGILLRTGGDPVVVVPAVRREIRALLPNKPLFGIRTLSQGIDEQLGDARGMVRIIAGFGLLALLLAALGLYGVVAFAVVGRTQEIGVRVALGARPGRIVTTFVAEGLRLSALGLGLGAVLALAFGRLLSGTVSGLDAADPMAALAVAAVLLAVAALASLLPASRAGAVDPMQALRVE